jgi:perosamine synthetase
MSCFSFQEKKILVTGDGGMVSSDDEERIGEMQACKEVGMTKDTYTRLQDDVVGPDHWKYDVKDLGFKYNMCDVIAAIGLSQLRKAGYIVEQRKQVLKRLLKGIEDCELVNPAFPYDHRTVYYDFMVRLPSKKTRDEFIVFMERHGVSTGVHTMPVPYLSYYKQYPGCVPTAMRIWEEYVVLPYYVGMSDFEIDFVTGMVCDFDKDKRRA